MKKQKSLKDLYTDEIYVNEEVLKSAPRNTVTGELEFFNLGKYASEDEVQAEYEKRGLIPADVCQLAQWNEANKDDDRCYFATQWKDKDGEWCYAAFNRWSGDRDVSVERGEGGWDGHWFFAGLRNVSVSPGTSSPIPMSDINNWETIEKEFYRRFVDENVWQGEDEYTKNVAIGNILEFMKECITEAEARGRDQVFEKMRPYTIKAPEGQRIADLTQEQFRSLFSPTNSVSPNPKKDEKGNS